MKEKPAVRANRITGQQKRNNITRYEKRVTNSSEPEVGTYDWVWSERRRARSCEISGVRVTYWQGIRVSETAERTICLRLLSHHIGSWRGGRGGPLRPGGLGAPRRIPSTPHVIGIPLAPANFAKTIAIIFIISRDINNREAGETCFVFTSLPRQTLDPEIYLIRWWSSRLFCCGFLCVDCQPSFDWWKRGPVCESLTLLRKIIYVDDKLLTPSVHRNFNMNVLITFGASLTI